MLVDEVEWIPSEEDGFIEHLCFSVSMELFGWKSINVDFKGILKSFLLHPGASIAKELNLVSTHCLEVLNDFGPNQVSLARIGQNADGSDIRC